MAFQQPTTLALPPICPLGVTIASKLIYIVLKVFDTSIRPSYLAWSVGLVAGDRLPKESSTGITSPSAVVPGGGHGRAHCASVG